MKGNGHSRSIRSPSLCTKYNNPFIKGCCASVILPSIWHVRVNKYLLMYTGGDGVVITFGTTANDWWRVMIHYMAQTCEAIR